MLGSIEQQKPSRVLSRLLLMASEATGPRLPASAGWRPRAEVPEGQDKLGQMARRS
jgi:hypothetical protein